MWVSCACNDAVTQNKFTISAKIAYFDFIIPLIFIIKEFNLLQYRENRQNVINNSPLFLAALLLNHQLTVPIFHLPDVNSGFKRADINSLRWDGYRFSQHYFTLNVINPEFAFHVSVHYLNFFWRRDWD